MHIGYAGSCRRRRSTRIIRRGETRRASGEWGWGKGGKGVEVPREAKDEALLEEDSVRGEEAQRREAAADEGALRQAGILPGCRCCWWFSLCMNNRSMISDRSSALMIVVWDEDYVVYSSSRCRRRLVTAALQASTSV